MDFHVGYLYEVMGDKGFNVRKTRDIFGYKDFHLLKGTMFLVVGLKETKRNPHIVCTILCENRILYILLNVDSEFNDMCLSQFKKMEC